MPHLRTRTPFNSTLLRFRSESIARVTQFFAERDFTQTHPPVITSSDCEGAGEVFSVETAEEPPTSSGDESFFRFAKILDGLKSITPGSVSTICWKGMDIVADIPCREE